MPEQYDADFAPPLAHLAEQAPVSISGVQGFKNAKKDGTAANASTRGGLNFVTGSGITLTVADDSANDEVDVTIAAVGATVSTDENRLSGDVTLTSANTFYDGPSLSLAAGTWLLVGKVTCRDAATAAQMTAKLWDGTTVEDSGQATTGGANNMVCIAVSGIVAPGSTTTYKISVASSAATNGAILAACPNNGAGNNASTLVAYKVA